MKNNEDNGKEEKKCKRCNTILIACKSRKAGYCQFCANEDKDARKAWEDKVFAKFCQCGLMLHAQESIDTGKCSVCRFKDGLSQKT